MNKPLGGVFGWFFLGGVIGRPACTERIRYFGIHFTLGLKARSETLQREGKVPTLLAAGRGGDVPRSELAPATILSWQQQLQRELAQGGCRGV